MKIPYFLIIAFILLFACERPNSQNQNSIVSTGKNCYNVAFLITDGVYNTEFTAPFDIFQHTKYRKGIKPMCVFTVSDKRGFITTFEGIKIIPDYTLDDKSIPTIDILVVPSAENHLNEGMKNNKILNWIKEVDKKATFVTSHCDGAFMLAKAGVLDSVISTTFPSDIPLYKETFPYLNVKDSLWFVHDGKYITSAGGARSFEAALYLTHILYGDSIAKSLGKGLVIDWDIHAVPHLTVKK